LDSDTNPTTIVLTRQNLINHSASNYHQVKKGAYVISPEKDHADVVLLASGSEVNAAIEAQTILSEAGMDTRVVSMPSMFYFNAQSQDYKESVLPTNVPVVAIEMATAVEYYQYTPHVFGINTFGASAPGNTNIQNYGFDGASIASRVKEMLDLT
jgi:transketolase